MSSVQQRIEHLHLADGTVVSFAVTGSGPPLVLLPGWVSHLELGWALPAERRFYEALSDGRTLIRYDRPGCGMSGPAPTGDLVATELDVIPALLRETGVTTTDLLGTSLSAPLAVTWAAAEPATVGQLVLYGGWVTGEQVAGPEVREHVLALVRRHWGLGSDLLTDIFAPGASVDVREGFSAHQRMSATAETAAHVLATGYRLDVSDLLAKVAAPTTVIHRRDDRAVPVAEGRRLAEGIRGARFVELPGRAHLPFVGDVDALIDAVRVGLGQSTVRRRHGDPTLTPRQLEVAALVAQGCSNKQIAERLVITERSAESHVERIRDRLGFRSRAQIAAWFVASPR